MFSVKDSGQRQQFSSGMRRDTQEGKPIYTLIDLNFLARWAAHMTKGKNKYGRDNWRLANSLDEYLRARDSATRHLYQWLAGDRDEDHAAAVCFNIMVAEHIRPNLTEDEIDYAEGKDTIGARAVLLHRMEQEEKERHEAEKSGTAGR